MLRCLTLVLQQAAVKNDSLPWMGMTGDGHDTQKIFRSCSHNHRSTALLSHDRVLRLDFGTSDRAPSRDYRVRGSGVDRSRAGRLWQHSTVEFPDSWNFRIWLTSG